jgi:ATP-binding cassette, subfamily B, bacterial
MQEKPRAQKLASNVALYWHAFRIVWDANPTLTAFTLLLTLLTAITSPVQVWISKLMIDRIGLLIGKREVSSWQSLLVPLALYISVWVVSQVSQTVFRSVQELLNISAINHAQYRIISKAATLDAAFFDHPSFYDQMTLAGNEVWRLANLIYQGSGLAINLISTLSLLFLLAYINPVLPAVLVLASLPKLVTEWHYTNRAMKLIMGRVPEERMVSYISSLLSDRETVKEVRLFQLQDYLLGRHRATCQQYVRKLAAIFISKERTNVVVTLISLLSTAGIWVYAGLRALAGGIGLGDIALVFQSVERSRTSLDNMANLSGYLVQNTVYLQNLFGFLNLQPAAVAGALSKPTAPAQINEPNMHGPIVFGHVSFRYPDADRDALTDITFTIQAGEKVALVGENGAGKTTLVKLLTRLYDPAQGSISINGDDLRTFDPQHYYRQLGVIFQDFARYSFTARENIGLGSLQAFDDDERIRKAARMGGATELIEKLPQGYATVLNKRFEGGVDLSGGEWQKVALSRAFMRDAALLILDEPTAALDAYAESEVYQRFAELTQGRTTVFVTHRLSSVRMADKILVLKGGRLIEEGNHASLIALQGEYAAMFNTQAEHYQPVAQSGG